MMRFGNVSAVVSVVIPCLDEETTIGAVVREVLAHGADEVIVVDNCSTDTTAWRARAAGAHVIYEPQVGYGHACAAGLRAIRPDADVVSFLDGDGSDVPCFLPTLVAPLVRDEADFVMGSRLRGHRERGSMTPQQIAAGRLSSVLLRIAFGARFTDMSPFRAMRPDQLRGLGLREPTYGWNLEMQLRVAEAGLRIQEIAVEHRRRRGGRSKVSGNLAAGVKATWTIAITFVRVTFALRHKNPRLRRTRSVGI